MATTARKRTGSKKIGGLNIETGGFNWKSGKAIAYYVIIAVALAAIAYMNVVQPG